MPRLLMMRHAKSSWDHDLSDDFSRPLNTRGRRAAELMGNYLAENGLYPQRILCSSAQRTRETLGLMLPYLPQMMDIRISRVLYEIDAPQLYANIRSAGETAETLLIIGHNPSMEDTAKVLALKGQQSAINDMEAKFPTGAMAIIDFDAPNWDSIVPGMGWLAGFITPRQLGDRD